MKTKKLNKKILAVLMSMMMCMSGFQITAFADVPADAPASVSSEAVSADSGNADTGSGSNSDSNTDGADIGGSGTGSELGAPADSSASGPGTVSDNTAAGSGQPTAGRQSSSIISGDNIIVDGNSGVTINNNAPESDDKSSGEGTDSKVESDDADSDVDSEEGTDSKVEGDDADVDADSENGEDSEGDGANSGTDTEDGIGSEVKGDGADNDVDTEDGEDGEVKDADADSNTGSEEGTNSESGISAEEAQANVEAAKAEVEQAEAAHEAAKGEADSAAADVSAAGAEVDKAAADLTAAEEAVSNAASEEEAAQAAAKLEEVKAALSQAEAKLADAKAKAESADAALAAAIEAFNQAQAKLVKAEEDAKNAANQGAGNSIGGGGGAGGGIADSNKEQGDAADKNAEKPEEKPDLETDEAARLQMFIDAAAQLPETVTEENYESVEAQLQNLLVIFGELTEEQQGSDEITAVYMQALALWEQVEGVKTMLLNETGVAKIGDKSYESFSEAMKALQDGETLVLQADVDSDGMYMVSSEADANAVTKNSKPVATQVANNIIIDLNGHIITASGNATLYGSGYCIFRIKGLGYTLTIINSSDTVGVINGKVVNSTAGTLNINGNVEIKGEYNNHTIGGNYGDININAPIDTLTITHNKGNVTVGKDGSVEKLTVNMPAPTSNNENWVRTLTINGAVTNLTVDQKAAHSMYSSRITQSTLTVNAPVETLKLTQGQAGGSYRADLWNKAYINAPIGTITASQSGKISELYLNSTVDTMDLNLNRNHLNKSIDDVPVTQAGSDFKVGTLNIARLNLVSFSDPSVSDSYANPMQIVDDIVLMTGMDGHQITAEQVGTTAWGMGNTSSGIGGTKLEYTDPESGIKANYKYLTKVEVIDGNIVLHKNALTGIPKVIYLNGGTSGNDNNDGLTVKTPVRTFAKAKELLGDAGLKTIYITGTVTISANEAWELEDTVNGTVKRYNTFKNAALINILNGADFTLKNITIDGGKDENVASSAPLITVQSGAFLTIEDGAVLQNNANSGSVRGGAINNKGEITIKGGLIQNNSTVESGGGIFSTGKITMNAGEIVGNRSTEWNGATHSKSTGGGVCIGQNGYMEMNGGKIANNSTMGYLAYGGGIALGDASNRTGMKLVMNGGTIEGNVCKGNGGGIAVWTGGEAEINGGYIINNSCNSNTIDWTLSYFGGGGIYVNKGATLTLKTVEVTNNKGLAGNGIAACPTSDVHFYVKNGGVFYGNGSSIWITTTTGGAGNVPVSITDYTLNGYKYNWNNGTVTVEDLNRVLLYKDGIGLTSGLTDEQGRSAAEFCNLHITGNSSGTGGKAYPGGGIGCNGTLIIGEDSSNLVLEKKVDSTIEEVPDKEFGFTINFKTDDGNAYTGSITLWRDGKSETHDLDSEGNVKVTLAKDEYVLLQDLPLGVKYTITESKNNADEINIKHTIVTDLENLDSYTNPTITVNGNSDGTVVKGSDEVIFTNVYNTIGLKVKKIVAGENPDTDKAFAFEIKLVDKDGNPYQPNNRTDSTEDESDFMGVWNISYEIFSDENTESLERGTLSFDENSAAKFELKHNQSIVFNKIPAGITALITELNESRVGYWTMIDHNGESMMTNTIGVQTGAGTDQSVIFTNTPIEPDEAALVVTKNISGDKPDKDASFKFNMALANGSNTDGVVMPENCSATVKGAGVTGFDIIKFTRAGKFQFVITESASEKEIGYEYDNTIWKVDIEVADKEDHLEVISVKYNSFKEDGITPTDSSYVDDDAMMVDQENDIDPDMMVEPETGAVFVNKYTSPKPTAFEIPVEKKVVVNGDNVDSNTINQTFNFTLADNNAADMLGYKLPEKTVLEITGEGSNKFRAIEFTKAGNYSFAVKETAGTAENWTYDNSEWIVDVKVDLNEDNSLSVSDIKYKKNGETVDNAAEGSTIIFTNTYDKPTPPPTPETPSGSLTITKIVQGGGSAAAQHEYRFTVTGPDTVNGTYSGVEFVNGAANVIITGSGYKTISGLIAGTYTVTEDSDSAAISGYRWSVTVSGNVITVNGASASVTVNEGENAKAAAVTFTNTYRRPPTDPEDPTPQNPPEDPSNPPEEPPTDVPDPDVPLVNIPEEPPVTEIPEEEPPLTNIPEEEPPLVDIPEEEPPLSDIPEEEPPLADMPPVEILDGDVPKTGDTNSALLWLVMSLMALFGMGTVLTESCVRRRRK